MSLLKGTKLGTVFNIRNDFDTIRLDGKADNTEPSKIILEATDGSTRTPFWIYLDSSGIPKYHTADPGTNPDGVGTAIGVATAGANTALGNLASVAINTHLIPATDGSSDLGTDAKSWGNAWVNTAYKFSLTTNDLLITATDQATAESTANFPSMSATPQDIVLDDETQTLTNKDMTDASNSFSILLAELGNVGGAAGDVAYWDGSNWVRLAKDVGKYLRSDASAVSWQALTVPVADGLASPFTIEGGANDPSTTVTAQTVGAAALTIPDLANVAQEWVFTAVAQTLTNKTLTSPVLTTPQINDTSLDHQYIFVASELAADRNVTLPLLGAADEFVFKTHAVALANKTLTAPKIVTTDGIADAGGAFYLKFVEDTTPVNYLEIESGDAAAVELPLLRATGNDAAVNLNLDAKGTGDVQILNGTDLNFIRATFDAFIQVADQTGEDHTFSIPDIATGASDTFAFLAEAQTLTNKTIDADANTISNINYTELDPVANVKAGIPFVFRATCTNVGGDVTVDLNTAFKYRILDAWSYNTSADGGTWKVKTDIGDVTNTVTTAASDKDIDRATQIDNANNDVPINGDLYVECDAGGDFEVFILCMRID